LSPPVFGEITVEGIEDVSGLVGASERLGAANTPFDVAAILVGASGMFDLG
jgi:hypothetical protein